MNYINKMRHDFYSILSILCRSMILNWFWIHLSLFQTEKVYGGSGTADIHHGPNLCRTLSYPNMMPSDILSATHPKIILSPGVETFQLIFLWRDIFLVCKAFHLAPKGLKYSKFRIKWRLKVQESLRKSSHPAWFVTQMQVETYHLIFVWRDIFLFM